MCKLSDWLRGKKEDLPTSTKHIDANVLDSLLRLKFPDAQLYLSDYDYLLCSQPDIKRFLEQDNTNRIEYKLEEMDCDDFAYRLMGQFSVPHWSALAFGICWTDLHALNCFIDEDEKFWYLEPQQDKIQKELSDWQGSLIRLVIM